MFYLLKVNCQYNQLISNGDLFHRVTTENKENLPAIIAGKANHHMTMIAAFHNHRALIVVGKPWLNNFYNAMKMAVSGSKLLLSSPETYNVSEVEVKVWLGLVYTNWFRTKAYSVAVLHPLVRGIIVTQFGKSHKTII